MATKEDVRPVTDMPGTRAAHTKLGSVSLQRAAVEAQIERGRALTDVIGRADAAAAEPRLLLEHRKLTADVLKAQVELEAAREFDAASVRETFRELKAAKVQALAVALRGAQQANTALQRLEQQEHEAIGQYVDFLAWPDLTPSSGDGRYTGRVEEWTERVRALGFV